jgi:hypothetical protein
MMAWLDLDEERLGGKMSEIMDRHLGKWVREGISEL